MTPSREPDRVIRSRGRREIEEIQKTCAAAEDRKINPFFLDVHHCVNTLKQYLPYWESFEDNCRDASTINRLSKVLGLQQNQLRLESSTLYLEPDFLKRRLKILSEKRLADIFVRSWHPVVEIEQLSEGALGEGRDYWNALLPFEERRRRFRPLSLKPPPELGEDEIRQLGIIEREQFLKQLENIWLELKEQADDSGRPYWKAVLQETYTQTIRRAYLISFLITYGYATLRKDGDEVSVIPYESPRPIADRDVLSLPISINREMWESWKAKR